jgi:hypothetical protein
MHITLRTTCVIRLLFNRTRVTPRELQVMEMCVGIICAHATTVRTYFKETRVKLYTTENTGI